MRLAGSGKRTDSKKDVRLGLLGRDYEDFIFNFDDGFKEGETNEIKSITERAGGIWNVVRAAQEYTGCIHPYCDESAISYIINDRKNAKRTSMVANRHTHKDTQVNEDDIDWLHVAYIDDLSEQGHKQISCEINTSIDFCKTEHREKYRRYIDRCRLVFDSRERKHLFDGMVTTTPIILHDEYGCECIINGEKKFEGKTTPVKGVNVNGAGDYFAAIFIRDFLLNGLEKATKQTSSQVTYILEHESKEI